MLCSYFCSFIPFPSRLMRKECVVIFKWGCSSEKWGYGGFNPVNSNNGGSDCILCIPQWFVATLLNGEKWGRRREGMGGRSWVPINFHTLLYHMSWESIQGHDLSLFLSFPLLLYHPSMTLHHTICLSLPFLYHFPYPLLSPLPPSASFPLFASKAFSLPILLQAYMIVHFSHNFHALSS